MIVLSQVIKLKGGTVARRQEGTKPTLLKEGMLDKIKEWAKQGIINAEIAKGLNIAESTLYLWKAEVPEVAEAFKQAEEYRVSQVVNAAYKRALGYEYDEVTEENGQIKKRVTKHIPGDTTIQQVILYNKDPEHWKSKNHSETLSITQNNISIEKIDVKLEELQGEWKKLTGNSPIIDVTPIPDKPE